MGAQFGIVMGPQRGAIHGKQLQSLENVSTAILRAPVPGRVIEQPFQRFGSHALARLRRCALAHKRSLRVGQRQAEIVQHFADRFMPVQRQGNHQPHHLLSRQAPMTDTGCVSAFDRLFNPLNRQMLAQPAPVWRFEVVGEEMDGVVEHGRRRLTAVQTVYNRPMKKCRSVLTERHYTFGWLFFRRDYAGRIGLDLAQRLRATLFGVIGPPCKLVRDQRCLSETWPNWQQISRRKYLSNIEPKAHHGHPSLQTPFFPHRRPRHGAGKKSRNPCGRRATRYRPRPARAWASRPICSRATSRSPLLLPASPTTFSTRASAKWCWWAAVLPVS